MKKSVLASFTLCLALAACMVCCDGTERGLIPNQEKAILNYISGKDITDFTKQDGVYRYIANADRDGYLSAKQVFPGDDVSFYFAEYPFTSAPGALFYTNKYYLVKDDPTINTTYWSFEPLEVRVGQTRLIEGLTRALPGCRQGDSVVLWITSDLAYDTKTNGVLPVNSALMVVLGIEDVKNN